MILTHQHIDHLGLVEIIVAHSGAEVAAIDVVAVRRELRRRRRARRPLRGRPDAAPRNSRGRHRRAAVRLAQLSRLGRHVEVTRPLDDGEEMRFRDRTLEVQHRPATARPTPSSGTTSGRSCSPPTTCRPHLLQPADLAPPRRLRGSAARARDLHRFPEEDPGAAGRVPPAGHGDPIIDHGDLIDDRFDNHRRRKEKIYELIAERPRSGYEIAQAIWGNVAVTQAFLTLSEVIGHVDLLVNDGRVREVQARGHPL